ncbi:unnamed protein product [Agarophyton chilense]
MNANLSRAQLHRELVKRVQFLLDLLCEVEQYPALYTNRRTLRNSLRRYEQVWIPLLVQARELGIRAHELAAPLDVQWVWMVHMLCPKKYAVDSKSMWGACDKRGVGVIIDHALVSRRKRQRGLKKARALWSRYFGHESFENIYLRDGLLDETEELRQGSDGDAGDAGQSQIGYDVIAACERQMMFYRHVGIFPQYRHVNFIGEAVRRYFMFLELKAKHVETVLVPTFDTDIVWHTHMMHPMSYRSYSIAVCKYVVPHDDTITGREDGADLDESWHETLQLWYAHFKQPFWRSGAMGRDNETFDERVAQAKIEAMARSFEETAGRQWDGQAWEVSTMAAAPAAVHEAEEWRRIEWVHAAQQRRLARGGGSVERTEAWSALQAGGATGGAATKLLARTVRLSSSTLGSSIMVEIFAAAAAARNDDGDSNSDKQRWIPLGSAYEAAHNSVCTTSAARLNARECALHATDRALVLRVCGADDAIVALRTQKAHEQVRVWFLHAQRPHAQRPHAQRPHAQRWQLVRARRDGTLELRFPDGARARFTQRVDGGAVLVRVSHAPHLLRAFALASSIAALRE